MIKIAKRVISVLLVAAMLAPTIASWNALSAGSVSDALVEVNVSTDKASYGALEKARVKVEVRNAGSTPISSIVVSAVSDDLMMINNGSQSSKYIFSLAPDSSQEYSFDVILSRSSPKVGFIYKILLFFKTLFMNLSKLSAMDTGNEIAAEETVIPFGSVKSELTVTVTQSDPDTITDAELAEMKKVDDEIDKLISNSDFKSYNEKQKENAIVGLLEDFENSQITNNSISFDNNSQMCTFSYANGIFGGVFLGDFSDNANGLEDQEFSNAELINDNSIDLSSKDALVLFSFNFSSDDPSFREPFYSRTKQNWESYGLNTVVDKTVTVKDLKNLDSDYEIICFSGHGLVYQNAPAMALTEITTDAKNKEYSLELKRNNIAIVSYVSDPYNSYYLVLPSLFKSAYGNNGLDGKYVFSETCCFLGEFGRYNYSLADTLVGCGAEAVVGFHNSVMAVYSRDFMKHWVDNLCDGKTAEQAYNLCVSKYGSDDGQNMYAAVPKLIGNKSASLVTATYTVKYDANGGANPPASQTKKQNVNLTLSSHKPTRSGYSFVGWSESPSAATPTYYAGSTYNKNASVTLYAVWAKNTYSVSYNANGGTNAPSTQTKIHGTNLTLSTSSPKRDGYQFLGWSTNSGAVSPSYYPGDTYSSNSSITLYAVWSKYEIRLSSYSGSGTQKASAQNLFTLDMWVSGSDPGSWVFGSTYKGFRVKLPDITYSNTPGTGVAGWTVYSGNCVVNGEYIYISQPGTVKVRYYSGGMYSEPYTYTLSLEKTTTDVNNIRSNTNSSATILGTVPANKTVAITSIDWNGSYKVNGVTYPAAWGKVNYGGKTGYIILWYTKTN